MAILNLSNPRISFHHGPQALLFDSIVGDAICGCVIAIEQWLGVSHSFKVCLNILTFWPHKNNAPDSASATEPATNFRSSQKLWIAPLMRMGLLFSGTHPRKKYPNALLLAWSVTS